MTVAFLVVNGDLKYMKGEINAISIIQKGIHFKLNTFFFVFFILLDSLVLYTHVYICIYCRYLYIKHFNLRKHLRNQYNQEESRHKKSFLEFVNHIKEFQNIF